VVVVGEWGFMLESNLVRTFKRRGLSLAQVTTLDRLGFGCCWFTVRFCVEIVVNPFAFSFGFKLLATSGFQNSMVTGH
jgi:hypothetical protein